MTLGEHLCEYHSTFLQWALEPEGMQAPQLNKPEPQQVCVQICKYNYLGEGQSNKAAGKVFTLNALDLGSTCHSIHMVSKPTRSNFGV